MKKVCILDNQAILAKINRIAYEIAERNFGLEELVVVGIGRGGKFIAEGLVKKLKEISKIKCFALAGLNDEKSGEIILDHKSPEKLIHSGTLLIVDDVLYSGNTLFRALVSLMKFKPTRVQTALLIDRGHRSLPLSPDFVGLELATTLKQHVEVEISADGKSVQAFLK